MKLHGARQLGSTSVLLNSIDKYVKKAKIGPFLSLKGTFRAIHANLSFDSSISTLFGQLYAKIEKQLQNSFGANGLKVLNVTFPTLKNDLLNDSTKSIFRYAIYVIPKKLHAKKETLAPTTPIFNNILPMVHSPMNTQWPWFDLSMPPKVKCHGVNWNTIYDLLYVFHAKFDNMLHLGDLWKSCDLYLTLIGYPRSNVLR